MQYQTVRVEFWVDVCALVPHLAKRLRLSDQNQQIGGQDGEAKVHQDDRPLRTDVPTDQRMREKSRAREIRCVR